MKAFEPFPIYDLRGGLDISKQPWLIPTNAFQLAEDVYFYQGRVFKRKGYQAFGQSSGGSGVTTLASPPVMGIYNYFTTGGASYLLAFDTDFMYQYSTTDDDWVGKGGYPSTPDWTGTDVDYFWCEVIPKGQLGAGSDLLLIGNNVDVNKVWDGSTLTDITGGNAPDASLFSIIYKSRVIHLNTQESGTRYPQRARCSDVGTYNSYTDDTYVDADTVDWITGAAFVRGELMVFFERSVWWLQYTGDATTPFSWQMIDETEGSYAPFSVVNFESEAIALGPTSWVACDGLRIYPIAEKVPDLILEMNQEKLDYSYGFIADELRQYLCSFASIGQDYPNKILALNYIDDAFSIYNLPIHAVGYWSQADTWTFDDVSVTMDEMTWSFDEKTLTAGYPTTIFGDRDGKTWTLFTNDDDGGSDIAARLKTKRLIPFQGKKSTLGYIDIIGESGSQLSFTIKCYKDYESSPYLSKDVSMYTQGQDKTRQRIRVMQKANEGHVIEIYDNSAGNPWVLDALIPWFQDAGPN